MTDAWPFSPPGETRGRIVAFLDAFYAEHGFEPSLREIGRGVGRSPSTVHGHLALLVDEGLVERRMIRGQPAYRAVPG